MVEEPRVVADLLALADSYEAKAKRLREAAAIVQGETITAPLATPPAVVERASAPATPKADGQSDRHAAVPADHYIAVMATRPDYDWGAEELASAINAAYGYSVRKEAARTMLYRLESRGQAVKAERRGTWRLQVEDAPASQDPLGRPFVQVVR